MSLAIEVNLSSYFESLAANNCLSKDKSSCSCCIVSAFAKVFCIEFTKFSKSLNLFSNLSNLLITASILFNFSSTCDSVSLSLSLLDEFLIILLLSTSILELSKSFNSSILSEVLQKLPLVSSLISCVVVFKAPSTCLIYSIGFCAVKALNSFSNHERLSAEFSASLILSSELLR